MAVTDEGIVLPVSTGAVKYDDSPTTIEQVADPSSTGAVAAPEDAVTTKFGPSGQKPAGNVETPGPQTFENLAVKVVNAPAKHAARGQSTAESDDSSGR